jgi:hypothetical protein
MALNSINRDFDKRTRDVNLLAKDFSSYRQRLLDFAKSYFPNQYNDFSDNSVGNMFIELVSYACDVLSYNIDYNLKESILTHASEQKNIISIAQSLGYKIPLTSRSTAKLKVFQLLPHNASTNGPDFNYALKIAEGMKVGSESNSNVIFRTKETIDFSNNQNIADPESKYRIFEQDENNDPLFWLVEYYKEVTVVSERQEKTLSIDVTDPQQFLTIEIPDTDVTEIISVTDSDNNTYFEVDSLAQDTIIDSVELDTDELPFFEPVIRRVPRRFITRVNKDLKLQIQFGSGTTDAEDAQVIESFKNILEAETSSQLAIDPTSFSRSKTYGKVPSNTTLTIKYSVGGGVESNVAQNDILNLNEVNFLNDSDSVDQEILSNIKSTLSFTNEEAATGGRDIPSISEIRQNALQYFSTQNRAVTAADYKTRVLAMPPKFGSVAKAVARKHQPKNSTAPTSTIDIHLLGYDSNKNLTTLNSQTKKNLSTYLNEYRLLTDGVNLLDGFIINIGVDFSISVYNGYNVNAVLLEAVENVKSFFDISKQDFFQPIYLSDLQLVIANVDGVRTVNNVQINNLNGDGFSNIVYSITTATKNGIIYPSIEPSIFEIKYPNQDIKGRVE